MKTERALQKKWTKKKKLDSLPPYVILSESLKESSTYLDKEQMELEGTMIKEGTYRDAKGNTVIVLIIPQELYRLCSKQQAESDLETVDLLNYFQKLPCAIDVPRAHHTKFRKME